MSIDPELLWRAFPDGYLAMRGVATVGGWQCIVAFRDGNPNSGSGIFYSSAGHFYTMCWPEGVKDAMRVPEVLASAALNRGDLLPNVDPSDTATWACLLAELGRVAGLQEWRTLDFYRDGTKHRWMLWAFRPGSSETRAGAAIAASVFRGPLFDTDDPALALVRALIHLREGGDAR